MSHKLKQKPTTGKQKDKNQTKPYSNMKLALWNAHSVRNKINTTKNFTPNMTWI